MPLLPQPLFLLHGDPAVRARVQRAVPERLYLVEVPGWEALRAAVVTAPPGSVALVDPDYAHAAGRLAPQLHLLLRTFPRLRVLARMQDGSSRASDALTLGTWGVADVLFPGEGDRGGALRKRLEAQRAEHFVRVLRIVAAPWLTRRGWTLVAGALDVAGGRAGAEEWAGEWGISAKTLLRRCHAAGLPPPRRLLAWVRVLLAADLLESPGHSIATAAVACGYARDQPLRRSVRQLTGTDAPALVVAGNVLATAAARFVAELEVRRYHGAGG